jgi:hypothetical protein
MFTSECKNNYVMKLPLSALILCLLFITNAWGDESWVCFHNEKEYFFESPQRGIPLKPLYQRETYYYDENSLQTTGLLLWKTVKVKVKIESWGVYSNAERIFLWEVDCEKKAIKRYGTDGRPLSQMTVEAGNEAADAFYSEFCY